MAIKPVIADVDGDGIPDLRLHFATQDAGRKCADTAVVVTGKTGGASIGIWPVVCHSPADVWATVYRILRCARVYPKASKANVSHSR